jgi:general stress protein YciG
MEASHMTVRRLRGFQLMSATRRREVARKGGLAAQASGLAHHWTQEEARVAGIKGGHAPHPARARKKI